MGQRRQLLRSMLFTALLAPAACYTYVPVETAPKVGENGALEISDKGRVELTDRFGPGLLRIEGLLAADSAEQYVMLVSGVKMIDGTSATWSNERIRVPHDYVSRFQARQLDKGRTIIAAAAATAAVVVFITSHGSGNSGVTSENPSGGTTQASILIHPSIH